MKLLDQGAFKSMVVTSEDVLNLTAGRSYSEGGHNLHFSTRILKHVRILTPDTNSEARANSDIWHEFWSTCEFWHLTRILKHAQILTPLYKHLFFDVWHAQILTPKSMTRILSFVPYPYSGLSQRVAPSINNIKKIEWWVTPKGSTMVCTCLAPSIN